MRRAPLVPVALALMAGILIAHLSTLSALPWAVMMSVAALTIGIFLLLKRQALVLWPVLLFCVGIGGLLCSLSDPRIDTLYWRKCCPEQCHIAVRLHETPIPREKSIKVLADVESIDGKQRHGQIRLYLRPDDLGRSLRYGDRLLIHGYPDTSYGWLYATSDHYIITSHDSVSLQARSEAIRLKLLHRMQSGPLEPRYVGIAEALTLGWKADIDTNIQSSFRDAGIAHLLAVSGLHVGLLALMIRILLLWIGRERRGRIVSGILRLIAVWLFALLTGLAPSTTRAALMFSLFIIADILGRRTPKINLLATAATITLACHPMLLFDIGWQLSYAAVTGILVAKPVIEAFHNKLWQAATVSVAATLATMPITITTFHRIHPYFLFANVVIVPLAGAMLGLSLIYMAVPCGATAWPLHILFYFTDWFTSLISNLPGASIKI